MEKTRKTFLGYVFGGGVKGRYFWDNEGERLFLITGFFHTCPFGHFCFDAEMFGVSDEKPFHQKDSAIVVNDSWNYVEATDEEIEGIKDGKTLRDLLIKP